MSLPPSSTGRLGLPAALADPARLIARLPWWARLPLAAAAGAAASLALPPVGWWPVLGLTVPVLVWLLDAAAREGSPWRGFAAGWCFGFGYFVPTLMWISEAFLVEAELFARLIPVAVAGLPAFLALYWGAASLAASLAWRPGASRIVVLAGCLTAGEWLRGELLTGFPWALPGYAASASDGLSQAASVTGIHGLTLLVLAAAAAPALLLEGRRAWLAAALAVLVAALHVAGTARMGPVALRDIGLRIVQPAIPQGEKWDDARAAAILQTYLDMSTPGPGEPTPDILIWPESALPFLLAESPAAQSAVASVLGGHRRLILGNLYREPAGAGGGSRRVFNSLLVVDGGGSIAARYDKVKLVPFGEFLPFAGVLEPLGLRQLVHLPQGFAAGAGEGYVAADGVPAFVGLICYEAIFPRAAATAARAEWLVNVTNDAWFGRSSGPYQHLVQARFRAIEQGLPMARAANTGLSAVIDPYGRVLAGTRLMDKTVLDHRLPEPLPPTVYARFGDWMPLVLMAALAAAVAAAGRRRR